MQRALPPQVLKRCRELRASSTDAEKRLWELLRNRQLGGFKFRRQHPMDIYILDFYCVESQLAIEVDGGGHAEDFLPRRDVERSRKLRSQGIRVLRFWNRDVLQKTEGVLQAIWDTLQSHPHPNPLPEGEGDGDRFQKDRER